MHSYICRKFIKSNVKTTLSKLLLVNKNGESISAFAVCFSRYGVPANGVGVSEGIGVGVG